MMGIMVPETCWASNKICNKKHLLHLVGILFPQSKLFNYNDSCAYECFSIDYNLINTINTPTPPVFKSSEVYRITQCLFPCSSIHLHSPISLSLKTLFPFHSSYKFVEQKRERNCISGGALTVLKWTAIINL
jgi:hypothetical protein